MTLSSIFFFFFFSPSQLNFQKTKSSPPTGAPGCELGALPAPAAGLLLARGSRPARPGGSRRRGNPAGVRPSPPGSRGAAGCPPRSIVSGTAKKRQESTAASAVSFFLSFLFFYLNSQRAISLFFGLFFLLTTKKYNLNLEDVSPLA